MIRVKDILTRETLVAYARLENQKNDYGASTEAIELLVQKCIVL